MKLVRLATIGLKTCIADLPFSAITTDDVEISVKQIRNTNDSTILLTITSVSLPAHPPIDHAGMVTVPPEPRLRCERAIQIIADSLSLYYHCERWIMSPTPCAGFTDISDAWKAKAKSILTNSSAYPSGTPAVPWATISQIIDDRPDGIALTAEMLAHRHPTGRFHEIMRIFERAFTLSSTALIKPLSEYLFKCNLDYSHNEIKSWIHDVRHPATHADKHDFFVLERDVLPVIARAEQAALDILINKAKWRHPSTDRLEKWRLSHGSLTGGNIFITKDMGANLSFRLLDDFSAFQRNLGPDGTAHINDVWFGEAPPKA